MMRWLFSIAVVLLFVPSVSAVEIVELSQTACQFVEPEKGDQHYQASSFDACKQWNKRSSEDRLKRSKTIMLKPGDYLFRVHNRDVPYLLGFWLRGEGIGRLTLPSVSGGGIETGNSRDYRITLEEGEYLYSCPLNPTPDYRVVVKP